MIIELPDAEIANLRLTNEQARLELAVGLYAGHQVTLGRAAKVAGVGYSAFMHELGRRGMAINYATEDALRDVETVRERLGQ